MGSLVIKGLKLKSEHNCKNLDQILHYHQKVLVNKLLLGKEDNIEMAELVDEFVAFYLAGQETTSNLLSFSLVLLQQHPDVLHR